MKIVTAIALVLLGFLAVASGAAKIALMQQDVDFFGKYGFSNPVLIAFGAVQLLGGILLVFRKARFAGATLIAITFLVSLVLLLMEGNIPVSIVTLVAILVAGTVMKQSWDPASPES